MTKVLSHLLSLSLCTAFTAFIALTLLDQNSSSGGFLSYTRQKTMHKPQAALEFMPPCGQRLNRSATSTGDSSIQSGAGTAWTSLYGTLGSTVMALNGQRISSDPVSPTVPSTVLTLNQFNFNLPPDAVINGITLTMYRNDTGPSSLTERIRDSVITLVHPGSAIPEDKKAGDWVHSPGGYVTYGGPTDLWGASWTPDSINSPDFGVKIQVTSSGSNRRAYIDYLALTIDYTAIEPDTTDPIITCPPDTQVTCTALIPPPDTSLVTTDGIADIISHIMDSVARDSLMDSTCINQKIVYRIWEAMDSCGNAARCIQLITVRDTIPPILICSDTTVTCADLVPPPLTLVSGVDNCGDSVTIIFISDSIPPLDSVCINQKVIYRTYMGVDECMNDTICIQRITIRDTIPPVFVCPNDTLVLLNVLVPVADVSLLAGFDNCGDSVVFSFLDSVPASDSFGINQKIIYRIYEAVDECMNSAFCTQQIIVQETTVLDCNDDLNVSLGANCERCFTADDVLEGRLLPDRYYSVQLYDATGKKLPDNCVDEKYIGYTLLYKVFLNSPLAPNSCWGRVTIEDKAPPLLNCIDDTIACYELPNLPLLAPNADECFEGKVELISDQWFDYGCDSFLSGYVIRTIQGTDRWGNFRRCTSVISIERTVLDSVDCPDLVELPCEIRYQIGGVIIHALNLKTPIVVDQSKVTPEFLLSLQKPIWDLIDPVDQTPSKGWVLNPAVQVVPQIQGQNIYPGAAGICKISSTYKDTRLDVCGAGFKIYREWTIVDWCNQQDTICEQYIKVTDTEAPVVLTVHGVLQYNTSAHDCVASVTLPALVPGKDFRDCNAVDQSYTIEYIDPGHPGKLIVLTGNLPSGQIILPAGKFWVSIQLVDKCYNRSSTGRWINISDITPPTPVCDEFTQVTLDPVTCWARIAARDLDNGSRDNCETTLHFAAARMSDIEKARTDFADSIESKCGKDEYWKNKAYYDQYIERWINCYVFSDSINLDDCGTSQVVLRVYEADNIPVLDKHLWSCSPHAWFCYNTELAYRITHNYNFFTSAGTKNCFYKPDWLCKSAAEKWLADYSYLTPNLYQENIFDPETPTLNGDAVYLGSNEYQLTDGLSSQTGTAFFTTKLDLLRSFQIEFDVYAGTNDGGGDGLTFLLQNEGLNAIGGAGGAFGANGIQDGLAIEFDTYYNFELSGESFYDHVAFFETDVMPFFSAINPPVDVAELEDGQYRRVRVNYDATLQQLCFTIDGKSDCLSNVLSYFDGAESVYAGFTAANGEVLNLQIVRLISAGYIDVFDKLYSDCMINVLVDDKQAPVVGELEDVVVYCDKAPEYAYAPNCMGGEEFKVWPGLLKDKKGVEHGYYGGSDFLGIHLDEHETADPCGYDNAHHWAPIYCRSWLYLDSFDSAGKIDPKQYFETLVLFDKTRATRTLLAKEFSITDNCRLNDTTLKMSDEGSLNGCGEGWIQRTWTIQDKCGNTVTAKQKVVVKHRSDFEVIFPEDKVVECDFLNTTDPKDAGEPMISDDECEQVGVQYKDEVFTVEDSACYKIVRTWTLIDWCIYNPNAQFHYSDVIVDDRLRADTGNRSCVYRHLKDNNDGYMKYIQVIKVIDKVAPTVTTRDTTICIYSEDCKSALVRIPFNATDNCTATSELSYRVEVDLNATSTVFTNRTYVKSSIDQTTQSNQTEFVYSPSVAGKHLVHVIVKDNCGNEDTSSYRFELVDCKKPTPYCYNGVATVIMPSNSKITVWAKDLDAGSLDNCTLAANLKFSFSSNSSETSREFTCADIPDGKSKTIPVDIWVTDEAGNQDHCSTYILLQDNSGNVCPDVAGLSVTIAGTIQTETNEPVEHVRVNIYGGALQMNYQTGIKGTYHFEGLPSKSNYSLKSTRDDQPMNGVSTLDLVLIQKHILGIELLDSPYKILAADVDNDKQITAIDLVELRKLILATYEDLPNNESWRFIPKSTTFSDPKNPWNAGAAGAVSEVLEMKEVTTDYKSEDFIGLKVGDVNATAAPHSLMGVEVRGNETGLIFEINDQVFNRGDVVRVDFRSPNFRGISGWQGTLSVASSEQRDASLLSDLELIPGSLNMKRENIGLRYVEKGKITMSWNTNAKSGLDIDDQQVLFTLVFKAQENGKLSEVLRIGSQHTIAESYQGKGELGNLSIRFVQNGNEILTKNELYQNYPNPFHQRTVIGIELEEGGIGSMKITDITGRTIKVIQRNWNKGYQEVWLSKHEMTTNGVLYYTFENKTFKATRRMILVQ